MSDTPNQSPSDDDLLAMLGEILAVSEPLSDDLVQRVSAEAFASRNVDAALAELVHDSQLAASGLRDDGGPRILSFALSDVEIDLQITDTRVDGTVRPPSARCMLETASGRRQLELDDFGRFTVKPEGWRFRITLMPDAGPSVATPWIFS